MAQLLDRDGRNLLIGAASNLRRWAGTQLGLARPRKAGSRPPTNLRGIAGAVRFRATRGSFEQRLVYERLMAGHVPPEKRRDLKTPAYLRLDPEERFPRIVVAERGPAAGPLFGPFRDRRAAAAARDALHKLHRLRPCDYVFEPDPSLPLGRGCVYAQVRSCAAPCLARVSEGEYRELARRVVRELGEPAAGACALVAERSRATLLLFPIRGGCVLDDQVRETGDAGLADALAALRFDAAPGAGDDTAWLLQWLRGRRRGAAYLVVDEGAKRSPSSLANALNSALAVAARGSPAAS